MGRFGIGDVSARSWRNRVKLVVGSLISLSVVAAVPSVSNADWDYVYGDPGPADYSRFQAVQLDPTGGAFLVGFFSGSFEGYSSPAAYRSFVQYRSADGAARWTMLLSDGTTNTPAKPGLTVNDDGTALVSTCSPSGPALPGATPCRLRTLTTSGQILADVSGSEALPAVATSAGFIRLTSAGVLEKVTDAGVIAWSAAVPEVAGASMAGRQMSTDANGGVWLALDVPRPLPTQRDAVALLHFDGSGTRINSILHYGYSLSAQMGTSNGFVTANREFFWINLAYDRRDYQPAYIHTVAFRVTDGSLLGPLTGRVSPLDGTSCVICGGYGLPYLLLPVDGVVGGGRRVVAPGGLVSFGGPTVLETHDLSGVTAITSTVVKSVPLAAGADGTMLFDADDLGNVVVAGATTGNVVFSTAAGTERAVMRTQSGGSPRAFVARNPGGRVGLKLTPYVPLEVSLTGINGVPDDGVSAVSLNVTATQTEGGGFVTVYPCGTRRAVSSLNYAIDQTAPNAVIAPLSATGTTCFYSTQPIHLLADVNGWFASGSEFTSVEPARIFDTRPGHPAALDVPRHKVGGATVLEVDVTGVGGVPDSGATAVSLNVTVTETTGAGFLTVYPCGQMPVVSSVNFSAGQTTPNAVIAPVSPRGTICLFSNVPTDVLADVNGWFAASPGFNPTSPSRLFDTRPGMPAAADVVRQQVGGSYILEVAVANNVGVPASGASAVSLNITVTGSAVPGFVTVFPCGPRPIASSLNFTAGQTVANAALATLSPSGTICLFANTPTDIVVDVNGWFASDSGFTAVIPSRVFDTR